MSRIYNTYLTLKKQNSDVIYLFKSGIFFLALDKDAYTLSNIFHFKLGNLTSSVIKCGFPCSSLNKYTNLFKLYNLNIKIIELDKNTLYTINEYNQNQYIIQLLDIISSVNTDNLSVSEAYEFIENLKNKVIDINNLN